VPTPDGRLAVTNLSNSTNVGKVGIWAPTTTRPRLGEITGLRGDVSSLAISPDGRWLAVGTFGACVYIHDLKARSVRGPYGPPAAPDIVMGLAFSRDSRKLAVGPSEDWWHEPQTWFMDPATGKFEPGPMPHLELGLRQVAFSPDGSKLLAASKLHARL